MGLKFQKLFCPKAFGIILFFSQCLVGNLVASVKTFFEINCIKCHGLEKSKGDITLHDIGDDFVDSDALEKWELILDVLKNGEMPPEEEKQRPSAKETREVAGWIENRLKDAITFHTKKEKQPLARRLSNFEYENTIRDLIGFHLDLNDNLPDDPEKPYRFNNTAEFMLLGPEQMDRYLENARQVMASAIVDPQKPEVDYLKREWKPYGLDRGMGLDEFGLWGNRRGSPAGGMGLKSFPESGEFNSTAGISNFAARNFRGNPESNHGGNYSC